MLDFTVHRGKKMADVKPRVKARKFYTITNAVELAPLSSLVSQFLDTECTTEHTHKAYRLSLTCFLQFLAVHCCKDYHSLSFSDVTRLKIKEFYSFRQQEESANSAALRLRVVKAFCAWMSRRYNTENPSAAVGEQKAPAIDFKGLDNDQYKAFINQARHNEKPLERFLPLLLVGTGLRNNEARHLTIGNISKDQKWLVRVVGKGGKVRNIPLTDDLVTELQIYMWWRDQFPIGDRSPLLLTRAGGVISNKTIWRIVQDTGLNAGLPEEVAHPHALRHTFAYRALDWLERNGAKVGRALIIVKDLLGHSSINTTMRYLGNQENDVFDLVRGMA